MFIAKLNNISRVEAQQKIDDLLDMVGLSDIANLVVGKFSRGMKQRLGIADVLIKSPKVIFLDEPTSGLDPEGIIQVVDLIGNLPKRGTTVILSSHQLYQVQRVCQSLAILSKGKTVVEDTLDSLGRKALSEGYYRIEAETVSPTPELIDAVNKVPGVRRIEAKENRLLVTANSDLRAEIAKVVVQSNFPLLQMRVQEFSLDDIYMKYFHTD
jgi:ABC-2 type transport system ATP-binding protein